MPTSAFRSRLETLRWRYDDERRRGSNQTTLALFGLVALALAFGANLLIYSLTGSQGLAVPGLARAILLVCGVGSLLLAAVFLIHSLLRISSTPAPAESPLRINPAIDRAEDAAIETLSSQYALATGDAARRNDDRARSLAVGGWSLAGGLVIPMLLLVWMLASNALYNVSEPAGSAVKQLFDADRSHRPAEISPDRSTVPLSNANAETRGADSDASEIDGACCLFEDRRPTSRR
ncbi:MAG: hypothetical protein NXI24_13470 [bacterium]|nr:hypothetical protein [bacterium]